jgi:3-phenylpropionate/trans-cinnamate dioxygenase ferredoxin subunit
MPDADRRHAVCAAAELAPGERRIVEVAGRSIGVFNVNGRLYALHNRCPHKGGALCAGRITGTALPTADRCFVYGREGEIIRCSRHGWEFEIASGRALADRRVRARTYPVDVEDGQVVVTV